MITATAMLATTQVLSTESRESAEPSPLFSGEEKVDRVFNNRDSYSSEVAPLRLVLKAKPVLTLQEKGEALISRLIELSCFTKEEVEELNNALPFLAHDPEITFAYLLVNVIEKGIIRQEEREDLIDELFDCTDQITSLIQEALPESQSAETYIEEFRREQCQLIELDKDISDLEAQTNAALEQIRNESEQIERMIHQGLCETTREVNRVLKNRKEISDRIRDGELAAIAESRQAANRLEGLGSQAKEISVRTQKTEEKRLNAIDQIRNTLKG